MIIYENFYLINMLERLGFELGSKNVKKVKRAKMASSDLTHDLSSRSSHASLYLNIMGLIRPSLQIKSREKMYDLSYKWRLSDYLMIMHF